MIRNQESAAAGDPSAAAPSPAARLYANTQIDCQTEAEFVE